MYIKPSIKKSIKESIKEREKYCLERTNENKARLNEVKDSYKKDDYDEKGEE